MYSLKEIRDYQESEYNRIKKLGANIHPKLLNRISYDILMSDEFKAAELEEQYNKVIRPLVEEYKKKLREMINEHLVKFIEGWSYVHPEGRWAIKEDTGTICSAPDYMIIQNFEDYIFDVEIDDYCHIVYEMLDDYQIKPFWTHTYTMFGDGYRKTISSTNSAVSYIINGRHQFKGYKTSYDELEKLAIDSQSLPFKMLLPPMTNTETMVLRDSSVLNIVKHHRVLHAFLEQRGEDAEAAIYTSNENSHGKITFRKEDL